MKITKLDSRHYRVEITIFDVLLLALAEVALVVTVALSFFNC